MTTLKLRFLVATAATMMAVTLVQAQNADQSKPATTPTARSSSTAAQSAATPASSSATKPAAAAKPAAVQTAASTTSVKDESGAQLIKDARNAGFKPEMIRGNQMFCRTAIELGSNFPVRTCYDADDVKIKIQEYQAQRNQLEQMHNIGMMTH